MAEEDHYGKGNGDGDAYEHEFESFGEVMRQIREFQRPSLPLDSRSPAHPVGPARILALNVAKGVIPSAVQGIKRARCVERVNARGIARASLERG
jgi:hypothetical protein